MKRKTRSKPEAVKVGNVTVKIYSRQRPTENGKRRTLFEVADYSNGVRRLRSFTEHAAALAEAEKIARQLSSGDVQAATMRNSDAASYGRAVELLRPTGSPLEIAAGIYAKAVEILHGDAVIEAAKFYTLHRADRLISRRVADVVTELIAVKKARGKSPRYLTDLRGRLGRFAKSFCVDIGTVTTADVQGFLDGLKSAPQTALNFRKVLGTLFNFAESRGYILKGGNPVADTEQITARGGKIEIFTPEEIDALLKAAPVDFLPIVALGAFAGLRAAEIERLEWLDVRFSEKFIVVSAQKAKTASRRIVPIAANLAAWLAPYSAHTGKIWNGSPDALKLARVATVKAAGVAWKHNALRHSFVSYRLAEIQNAAQVALEAGNSPQMIFRHYRELVRPADAVKWFSVTPEAAENVIQMNAAK